MKRYQIALVAIALIGVMGAMYDLGVTQPATRTELKRKALERGFSATLDCSWEARMDAAAKHFESGCLLTAIRICSQMSTSAKLDCYGVNEKACEGAAASYKAWLMTGKPKEI